MTGAIIGHRTLEIMTPGIARRDRYAKSLSCCSCLGAFELFFAQQIVQVVEHRVFINWVIQHQFDGFFVESLRL